MNSGAVLTIDKIGTGAQGPQYGTVKIAPDGKSLIYTPTTLDYLVGGILTGNQDAFQVSVKDSVGGEVTSFVTVNATPVADSPTVTIKVLTPEANDPVNEVRLLVTAQSGDYGTVDAGSDFIKSLLLSGSAFSAATQITDSDKLLNGNTINASSNTGLFTDEIDLTLPTLQPNTALNDTLAITATAAETESPTTTATFERDQPIAIHNVDTPYTVKFKTTGQSIWGPGEALTTDYSSGFLGWKGSTSIGFQSPSVASLGVKFDSRGGALGGPEVHVGRHHRHSAVPCRFEFYLQYDDRHVANHGGRCGAERWAVHGAWAVRLVHGRALSRSPSFRGRDDIGYRYKVQNNGRLVHQASDRP